MKQSKRLNLRGREPARDALSVRPVEEARRRLQAAIEAEVETFIAGHAARRTDDDRAAVVRIGHPPDRALQNGLDQMTMSVPKVGSRGGEPVTIRLALVPPYARKTRTLEAALPWLHLKGISSGERQDALEVLVGPDARGSWPAQPRD